MVIDFEREQRRARIKERFQLSRERND